jgi:hypothetical protein
MKIWPPSVLLQWSSLQWTVVAASHLGQFVHLFRTRQVKINFIRYILSFERQQLFEFPGKEIA